MNGIALLHRAQQGWHFVSEVAPDNPDLTAELSALRDKAIALDASGLRTKLVIPDDQIKYLSFDAHGATGDDLEQAIRATLDGATPYPVDELVYDWCVGAGQIHIAAVASETLAEAEAFAVEHGFNPLSFVAKPENGNFVGEPFLGQTRHVASLLAKGQDVVRDNTAIRILGVAPVPDQPAKPESVEESEIAPDQADTPAPSLSPSLDDKEFSAALESAINDPLPPSSPPEPSLIEPEARKDTPLDASPKDDSVAPEFASIRAVRGEMPTQPQSLVGAKRDVTPDVHTTDEPPAPITPPVKASLAATEPAIEPDADETLVVKGKPRHLALILTMILLIVLAGVAAWASLFLEDGVAQLFRKSQDTQVTAQPADPEPIPITDPEEAADLETDTLPTETTDTEATDQATLQPLQDDPEQATQQVLTSDEALARYAATGIWQIAPAPPQAEDQPDVDDLYQTSIDTNISSHDAVALPDASAALTDTRPSTPASPSAQGTRFQFDDRGFVVATKEGATTPEGVRVFAGKPQITPPQTPQRETADDLAAFDAETLRTTTIRPRLRPADLIEQNERGTLNGHSRAELAILRPA